MNSSLQITVRFLSPGILAYIALLPFFSSSANFASILAFDLSNAKHLGLAFVIGALFIVFDIRHRFDTLIWGDVHGYRLRKLKEIAINLNLSNDDWALVSKSGNAISSVCWKIIDDDNSLTIKGKSIRLNGTVVTSFFDAIYVWLLSSAFLFAACYIPSTSSWLMFYWGLSCYLLSIVFITLLPRLRARHKRLIDDQLNSFETNFGSDFVNAIRRKAAGIK